MTNEREQAIRTVADFALMGFGGIRDALSLAQALQRPHGFAGFSMGGNLAALAAAASPHPAARSISTACWRMPSCGKRWVGKTQSLGYVNS